MLKNSKENNKITCFSDFIIKSKFNTCENNFINNFMKYIFGYEEKIKFNKILDTSFFKSEYYGSSIDKLFPLSSMPKNGNCFKNTFLNENGKVQIHVMIEEDKTQFKYLIESISQLLEKDQEFLAYYLDESMFVPSIFIIKNNQIKELSMMEDEYKYKKLWSENFHNLDG